MIIFDTETTGLPLADSASLKKQPKIIEFAGLKVNYHLINHDISDEDFVESMDSFISGKEVGNKYDIFERFEFLCNPGEPLEPIITKITGITDEDLADKDPIQAHWKDLSSFFLGETSMVAHNLPFDLKIMKFEAMRMNKLTAFPWPMRHICTVESTFEIKGARMKLGDLYKHLFDEEMQGWHRAMSDVRNLARITNELINQGYIKC